MTRTLLAILESMNKNALVKQIQEKESFLCVGLDTVLDKIPHHLLSASDPIFEFNKQIIDATIAFTVAYKPNIAFYEVEGSRGWDALQKTIEYIPKEVFTIADAKRGDIGNTSRVYAMAFFEKLNFDAITVTPYMGSDSVKPFLEFKNKWVILLAVTSNLGGFDFQYLNIHGEELFKKIIRKSTDWGSNENMMYVVGATRPEALKEIRKIIPDHFLLIPGLGAQGGDLKTICKHGLNQDCGLLVNSSRGIIYSDSSKRFTKEVSKKALDIQREMAQILQTL